MARKKMPPAREVRARVGSQITDADAQLIDGELQALQDSGLPPNATHLVARAKDVDSPIHHLFEWNTTRAAERYWRSRARELISSVVVLRIEDGFQQREWEPVTLTFDDQPRKRRYVRRAIAVDDDDAMAQLSAAIYARILSEVRHAESLGLCERDPKWNSLYRAITSHVPRAALEDGA